MVPIRFLYNLLFPLPACPCLSISFQLFFFRFFYFFIIFFLSVRYQCLALHELRLVTIRFQRKFWFCSVFGSVRSKSVDFALYDSKWLLLLLWSRRYMYTLYCARKIMTGTHRDAPKYSFPFFSIFLLLVFFLFFCCIEVHGSQWNMSKSLVCFHSIIFDFETFRTEACWE